MQSLLNYELEVDGGKCQIQIQDHIYYYQEGETEHFLKAWFPDVFYQMNESDQKAFIKMVLLAYIKGQDVGKLLGREDKENEIKRVLGIR